MRVRRISEVQKRRNMISKIEDELVRRETEHLWRWCEITMKRTGQVLRIVRTGYGPAEYPERDSHEIQDEDTNVIFSGERLWDVANWIYENR